MVSMVIVVIVFSLSSMVIANVTKTGMSKEKQDAYILVKSLRNETLKNARFIDENIAINDLMIEKTILDYRNTENVGILLISVSKGEEKLFESRELIILSDK